MKLIMTRDDRRGSTEVEFWTKQPSLGEGVYGIEDGSPSPFFQFSPRHFKSLTGEPLPRKGSKKQVDVSLVIKGGK